MESALEAREWFEKKDIPFARPNDYFAEMIKSDSQMNRIRQHLLEKAFTVQKSEEARHKRESAKYAKEVAVQRKVERQEQKKRNMDQLDAMVKKRKRNANNEVDPFGDDFEVEIDNELGVEDKKAKRNQRFAGGGKNAKRRAKDSKFGFGGKANNRLAKQNDSKSTWDPASFSLKKNKTPFAGGAGGGGSGGAKKRPGKSIRSKQRKQR